MELNQVKSLASNIVCNPNNDNYTIDMFLQYYPMFSKIVESVDPQSGEVVEVIEPIAPIIVMEEYLAMAKDAIQIKRWGPKWKMAMGLYIAHYLTLYLKSYAPSSKENDVDSAAASGTVIGNVSNASEGDQSIGYDNSALTEGTSLWGTWNATTYGQQLITEAKLLGMGGSVIL